jgi:hypothetical protein
MGISLKTHKMLWGRSANRCAVCRIELVMDATETDDPSLVGEACHLVAKNPDGPRGESPLTPEQRDLYGNLILLCAIHHKQVDDQSNAFTVEKLIEIKAAHEGWVKSQLEFDAQKQKDDETYSGYIENWADRVQLDDWMGWTSALISHGQPALADEMKQSLEETRSWLLSRVWPGRHLDLEGGLANFRFVIQDLCQVFGRHAKRRNDGLWETEKFYKLDHWDPSLYSELSDDFDEHVDLVQDLTLEMTRAANYVCDLVRKHLVPAFRMREGVLLVQGGPYMDLTFKSYRVEYGRDERISRPYPGLGPFMTARFGRDHCFGEPKKAGPAKDESNE